MRATTATLVLSCSGDCEVHHYYRWNLLAHNEFLRPRNGAATKKWRHPVSIAVPKRSRRWGAQRRLDNRSVILLRAAQEIVDHKLRITGLRIRQVRTFSEQC